jgi:hypothetical protein
MASVRFKNFGKTPAIVSEVEVGLVYSETPPDPVYDVRVVRENVIAPDHTTENFPLQMTGQMTFGMANNVIRGIGTLWIYGRVAYEDVFGEPRTHRFFQRYVRIS